MLGGILVHLSLYDDIELNSYTNMSDEHAVAFAKTDDAVALEYLINKYKNIVKCEARY